MKTKDSDKLSEADDNNTGLRLIEKRKQPRFLLSNEQFLEKKSGKIFQVYDLSLTGLAIRVDERVWDEGSLIKGVLNLHPDSIEITPRLIAYYGDRAALKLESVTTYGKEVLQRSLSPKRLGTSLKLVREKLPLVDLWYHGVCNTDLLLKTSESGTLERIDMFFANHYWGYSVDSPNSQKRFTTGICYSFSADKREMVFVADSPIHFDSIEIEHDLNPDASKLDFAMKIVESSNLDNKLKDKILKNMKKGA